ncbi:hypothetical protein CgunFtcFv8_010986 [Champsocephalus gunnari]|uniref:Uncharacterized protein n=1 Tax=Champsocephalus gunnari TaxID=52237 RepID=A0AAN8E021_CHAGU|nr:hypothetical protein CgunFtcFv8_010986 [Champsocephalus gunnari]
MLLSTPAAAFRFRVSAPAVCRIYSIAAQPRAEQRAEPRGRVGGAGQDGWTRDCTDPAVSDGSHGQEKARLHRRNVDFCCYNLYHG